MPSSVQSLVAVHHCRFAFKCNTHQHPKTIQSFSLPQNFIRKSEPVSEHKKRLASNANPELAFHPQTPRLNRPSMFVRTTRSQWLSTSLLGLGPGFTKRGRRGQTTAGRGRDKESDLTTCVV
jgi:hypothetical protein